MKPLSCLEGAIKTNYRNLGYRVWKDTNGDLFIKVHQQYCEFYGALFIGSWVTAIHKKKWVLLDVSQNAAPHGLIAEDNNSFVIIYIKMGGLNEGE